MLAMTNIGATTTGEGTKSLGTTTPEFNVGDYFIIGQYNDAPILWRYIDDDENGKLLISDKVLCFKWFGHRALWLKSNLRAWLNSDASSAAEID